MAENITSFYDLYNRANDAGKATDIQPDDLFIMQRGTGSNRNKCIKGSDLKLSSALVIATAGDTVPATLIQKLYNSDTINFDDTTVAGNKKIVAELRTNSVDTAHLKDSAVTTSKIAEGAVTESKIALNSIQEQAIKNLAVTTAKLGNASVSTDKLQNNAVTGAKLGMSVINQQYDVGVLISEDFDANNKMDHLVHQFSAVGPGGIIDINLYVLVSWDSYIGDAKFEIRKSGSSTAESTWEVDEHLAIDNIELSRRMVVKNGSSESVNYELHLVGDTDGHTIPSGISGFLACKADIRGVSIA